MRRWLACPFILLATVAGAYEPIHISFLWHMHQPIYYPYETPIETDAAGRYGFSVVDVHNQRHGPYTSWPADAIGAGLSLPHLGAQVSFSGSLIENLDALEAAGVGGGMWTNWPSAYAAARAWQTSLGNARLELVAFGYHHPLMPLLDEPDLRMQIRLHRYVFEQTWPGGCSRGMFPPETAFAEWMIPVLVSEGIEWVLVDNIHFDRACINYPHTNASGLFAPNPADQINPDPAASGGAWVQLTNIWAPSPVSAPFGYQPHYVQWVDPASGQTTRLIAVPAARYEGNEDARGGYGAFLYDQVMDQYIAYNSDPAHPMLVVLHHDGDNFGGGSDAYYHNNFQNMVNWVSGDPDYDVTTIEDYLQRYPPEPNDVIHVEPGAWAGADAGDPEFKKWLADPDASGWSPDIQSWAELTAAKNRVFTAEAIAPAGSLHNVWTGTGSPTEQAWHWLLCGEASDYWYWDGQQPWDSNVTRACNQAVIHADAVIATGDDTVPPTVFLPQREPYNPGGLEFGTQPEPSDFEVWTLAYDVSGLASVTLYWRIDNDGVNPLDSTDNETYAGGPEVGPWNTIAMTPETLPDPPPGQLVPTYRAQRYSAQITGQQQVLIDYFVEAVDTLGHTTRTIIQHVYVGTGGAGGGERVSLEPDPPVAGQSVTIRYQAAGGPLFSSSRIYLHYGLNNWSPVIDPDPEMTFDPNTSFWSVTIPIPAQAWQLDFVFRDNQGRWDNNNGADWHFAVTGTQSNPWQLDGTLDAGAVELAANNGVHLWAGIVGDVLYVATEDAGEGFDHFVYLARTPGPLRAANWAKSGLIASWDAYLADENDNDFAGWFDTQSIALAATGPNGGVLEGTIDLAAEFGTVPDMIHLAVGHYATPDGGPLDPAHQVPAPVIPDFNIDAVEYLPVDLGRLRACMADLDGDGAVDLGDLSRLLSFFGTGGATPADGDLDHDGDVDLSDLSAMLAAFGLICP